jgi:invasion protein IalB
MEGFRRHRVERAAVSVAARRIAALKAGKKSKFHAKAQSRKENPIQLPWNGLLGAFGTP